MLPPLFVQQCKDKGISTASRESEAHKREAQAKFAADAKKFEGHA